MSTHPISQNARASSKASEEPIALPLIAKTLREFLGERSVIEYLVHGLLRRAWLYAFTGNTGGGKTAVAVTMTLSVKAGLRIAGFQCERGNALYIAGENPDDVRTRFAVAVEKMGIDDANVHVIDQSFLLNERIVELCALIERYDIALVIVDTDQAVSLNGVDSENDNGERMAHAKQLRLLTRCSSRPTVIDLCHPRKNAQRDDLVPRGGSAFLNEIDGNFRLWRDGDMAELWSDPNKFRGKPVTISYRMELVETDAVCDQHGRHVPVPFFSPIDEVEALKVADAQWRDENRLLFVMDGNPAGTQAQWAEACAWFGEDRKPRKDKVNRLLQTLVRSSPQMVQKGRSGRWTLTAAGKREAEKP